MLRRKMRMNRLYFDHAATTPVAPEVLEVILPYLNERFGNPSSVHSFGVEAREAVEKARREVSDSLQAEPGEIYFTSGGTEADVIALRGVAYARRKKGDHIITSAVEHHAVLETCLALDTEGFRVTVLPVDEYGRVRLAALEEAISDRTILVSVMHANNEVGTVQPVREICDIAHRRGVTVHTDAVQSFGKIPVSVREIGADLLSISGHKIYGPKGIGALYIREGTPYEPVFQAGGQERGRRPGTENVPGIAGMGKAAAVAAKGMKSEAERLSMLRVRLVDGLRACLDGVVFNGHPTEHLPGTVHFSIAGIEGGTLLSELDRQGIAVSCGAACTAGHACISHVLSAMGVSAETAVGSVRVSMGRSNTEAHIDRLIQVLAETVQSLRAGSA
ncbi:MAG: cysteine desulfurase family protein [Bacillota bacterium]